MASTKISYCRAPAIYKSEHNNRFDPFIAFHKYMLGRKFLAM